MHHVFQRLPRHLEDTFDELPAYEPRVHDHTAVNATRPSVHRRKHPELWRPLMSEAEAKARAEQKRPPIEVERWLADMLARKGMRPDNLLLLWDPQMPRWSFWCRSKHEGHEVGYSRVWIVGEQEAKHRGRATDLDERAEYYQRMGTMGPYRLPTKDEIDRVMGEVATLDADGITQYLFEQQQAEEAERERELDDWTMDYIDHGSYLDAWRRNGGIRTWCMQGGWLSDAERWRARLAHYDAVEIDKGTHKVVVRRGTRLYREIMRELREADYFRKPADQRDLEFVAKETRLGRVRLVARGERAGRRM